MDAAAVTQRFGGLSTWLENRRVKVCVYAVLTAGVLALNVAGFARSGADAAGLKDLRESNLAYLSSALDETERTFTALSLFRGSLSLLESGQAGISFVADLRLQVGEVLEPVNRIVGVMWSATLASLGFFAVLRLVVPYFPFLGDLSLSFLAASLLFYFAARLWFPRQTKLLLQTVKLFALPAALFHVLFPLTLHGMAAFSDHAAPIFQETHQTVTSIHGQLQPDNERDDWNVHVKGVFSDFKSFKQDIESKTRALVRVAVRHLAAMLLTLVVFPAVLLALLWGTFEALAGNLVWERALLAESLDASQPLFKRGVFVLEVLFFAGFGLLLLTVFRLHRAPAPHAALTDGIDVSHYDGEVDWAAVRAAGVDFAYIKASDGKGLVDPLFQKNWVASQKAGIPRGAYHFFHPQQDVTLQLKLFQGMLKADSGELPPVIDVEEYKAEYDEDCAALQDKLGAFVDGVKSGLGRPPMIYTNTPTWNKHFCGTDRFASLPLWLAEYSVRLEPHVPNGWGRWDFWQYSEEGRVPGVKTNVDRSRVHKEAAQVHIRQPAQVAER